MSPIERVLAKLPGAKRNGSGWIACCPAHDDRNPSLSIGAGADGRALLTCHAGCKAESIVAALGLTMRDLMPTNGATAHRPRGSTPAPRRPAPTPKPPPRSTDAPRESFATPEAAIAALERSRGPVAALWHYHNAEGDHVGDVLRWNKPDSTKDILPIARDEKGGWAHKGMPEPRPLYNLQVVREAETVYVVEGEKAADALIAVGLVATTSAGGSRAAKCTDWAPLAGKRVFVLPDNDAPGRKYASDVVKLLQQLAPPPAVSLVALPDLPDKGDAFDSIAAWRAAGDDDDAIRAQLERLAASAKPIDPEADVLPAALRWKRFPVELLPEILQTFVVETANALGCDPAFVAVPVLAVVASAIGTTRAIELKASWREFPIVWAVVVARSGTLKSPAYEKAAEPLHEMEREAAAAHKAAMQQYERELREYKRAAKDGGVVGDPPKAPKRPRHVTADVTIEALALLLEQNPRGLLVARDELSGWIRSFNQYKRGQGSDEASWLQLWQAKALIVDRKTGPYPTIYVPRAAVSIIGTIQPGVLRELLSLGHFESGLMARLLIVEPRVRRKVWSERSPSTATMRHYADLIRELCTLCYVHTERGPEPVVLAMTAEAKAEWEAWYNRHAVRIHEATDDRLSAALAKIEAYAARFALLLTLARNPLATIVDAEAVRAGCALADWFAHEAMRVYATFAETEDDTGRRKLLDLIQRKGGSITPRELVQSSRDYPTTADAEAALNKLAEAGAGRWEYVSTGGRQSKRFVLIDTPEAVHESPPAPAESGTAVYESPADGPENEAFVNVDNVDAPDRPAPDDPPARTPPDGDDSSRV